MSQKSISFQENTYIPKNKLLNAQFFFNFEKYE